MEVQEKSLVECLYDATGCANHEMAGSFDIVTGVILAAGAFSTVMIITSLLESRRQSP